jgi:hypothetical protein
VLQLLLRYVRKTGDGLHSNRMLVREDLEWRERLGGMRTETDGYEQLSLSMYLLHRPV